MTTTMFHSAAGWYGGGGREKKVWVDGGEGGLGGVSRKIINAQTLCKVPKRHPAHKAIKVFSMKSVPCLASFTRIVLLRISLFRPPTPDPRRSDVTSCDKHMTTCFTRINTHVRFVRVGSYLMKSDREASFLY